MAVRAVGTRSQKSRLSCAGTGRTCTARTRLPTARWSWARVRHASQPWRCSSTQRCVPGSSSRSTYAERRSPSTCSPSPVGATSTRREGPSRSAIAIQATFPAESAAANSNFHAMVTESATTVAFPGSASSRSPRAQLPRRSDGGAAWTTASRALRGAGDERRLPGRPPAAGGAPGDGATDADRSSTWRRWSAGASPRIGARLLPATRLGRSPARRARRPARGWLILGGAPGRDVALGRDVAPGRGGRRLNGESPTKTTLDQQGETMFGSAVGSTVRAVAFAAVCVGAWSWWGLVPAHGRRWPRSGSAPTVHALRLPYLTASIDSFAPTATRRPRRVPTTPTPS